MVVTEKTKATAFLEHLLLNVRYWHPDLTQTLSISNLLKKNVFEDPNFKTMVLQKFDFSNISSLPIN